jgi:protein-S-isoprenylcysteine O-methyltransferase Ste14
MQENTSQKNTQEDQPRTLTQEQRINYLGSFPPIIQFVGVILGVLLEFVFPTKMFPPQTSQTIGVLVLVLATIIIFWAQRASAEFRRRERNGEAQNFSMGPYKWSDNPTSFALFLLVIGFGFLMNSLMVVIFSGIGYWISHIVYQNEKGKIMLEKYKGDYVEYKKKVKSLF